MQKFIENEGINESRNIIIEILNDTPIAVSATAVVYPEESTRYTRLCRYYTLTMIKGVWYLESMLEHNETIFEYLRYETSGLFDDAIKRRNDIKKKMAMEFTLYGGPTFVATERCDKMQFQR